MSNAAIYARVSSARQKEQETIGSQTAALRAHAEQLGLDVPPQWVFCDDGHSGAILVRPALEKLRDLVAQVPVDVVLVYAPDRLARKYAYQALLIEEFAKAGTSVLFVKGPSSDSPEDALLVQFQGMIAEYERAQIIERTRRGKTHRARQGTVNVLSGAPFGYRYVRKNEHADARYEVVAHEAAIVTELFRRYVEEGATIADLARWLTATAVPTRTGKSRWDRSVIWGMLRNPAYAGRACFGKTMRTGDQPGLNRTARLAGRSTPKSYSVTDRPRPDWLEIAVPALVAEDTWQCVQRRLADNKRYAARNSKVPSLLQGLAARSNCGYAYYRGHTTTTAGNKIYYYRCLGSDNYRYENGRVCDNKPVRTDYLNALVWDHITSLLADPTLIRAEIDRRLDQLRTTDPTTAQRQRLKQALAKASTAITRLIKAYQEELISIDELRERMPELRGRETTLRTQLDALAAQLVDREAYLQLATGLEDFLAQLRTNAATTTIPQQQRVLRLLVKDVLIGPERILIRHSIPPAAEQRTPPRSPQTMRQTRSPPQVPHCVGGVNSPVLANLYLHYAFDMWLVRTFPTVTFERYCDDAVIHCVSEEQARQVRDALVARLAAVGLELHPDKTRIVYCKDADRRGDHEVTSFTFLGYTFRPRLAKTRWGKHFVNFLPAVSRDAITAMGREIRSWHIARRSDKSLTDLARMFNSIVQGWINYFGRFYKSMLYPLLRRINDHLVRWAMRKYKRLRRREQRARELMAEASRRSPQLFAHWRFGLKPGGWTMGAV